MATPANLFQPIKVGRLTLSHRVVLSPMTRCRTKANGSVLPVAQEYYAQGASRPGTLLFTEGTSVAARAGGIPIIPGIWSDEQMAAWKPVVDAVHAKGSFIYLQLGALGRRAIPDVLKAIDPSFDVISAGDIPTKDGPATRGITKNEIKENINFFRTAASNAIERVGFDGVEIHGGNGFLLEQFLHDSCNNRTDEYGGSIDNRAMGMEDPKTTYTHLAEELKKRYPDLAYLHVVEPRTSFSGSEDSAPIARPCIALESALQETSDNPTALVAFGRHFLANPDLPARLERNIPLNKYNRGHSMPSPRGQKKAI
ncbi:hypothetical protein V5O48_007600 [Marasmius crinis-equi]|uniref:NADH:flavin oxidoreductase/NADH oxidase N-terminal domain-containing protein n=1 Tax=Marasmius crinis-equi TaxID=585013 RepID=A0ABR3FGB7_9AGAR